MRNLGAGGKGKGKVRFLIFEAGTKNLLRTTPWSENTIALNEGHGMNGLVKQHLGMAAPLEITEGRFGTGGAARTADMTDLTTPYASYFDKTNQYQESDGSATFEFFVPSGMLPNDTYTEFGIYCDEEYYASALLDPDLVKGTNQDVLVQYTLTYTTT